jgi:DNA-directed RNA polymerase specialized sigma24 family protein
MRTAIATSSPLGRRMTPLESAIGADVVRRYESAMAKLSDEERRLLHLRIELALDYAEIALMLGRTSPSATRMAIQRSLHKLARMMGAGA